MPATNNGLQRLNWLAKFFVSGPCALFVCLPIFGLNPLNLRDLSGIKLVHKPGDRLTPPTFTIRFRGGDRWVTWIKHRKIVVNTASGVLLPQKQPLIMRILATKQTNSERGAKTKREMPTKVVAAGEPALDPQMDHGARAIWLLGIPRSSSLI